MLTHTTRHTHAHTLHSEFPGELEKIMVWFRDYKTPDGKPRAWPWRFFPFRCLEVLIGRRRAERAHAARPTRAQTQPNPNPTQRHDSSHTENAFGYDSKPLNAEFAASVISSTHGHYRSLKEGARENDVGAVLA